MDDEVAVRVRPARGIGVADVGAARQRVVIDGDAVVPGRQVERVVERHLIDARHRRAAAVHHGLAGGDEAPGRGVGVLADVAAVGDIDRHRVRTGAGVGDAGQAADADPFAGEHLQVEQVADRGRRRRAGAAGEVGAVRQRRQQQGLRRRIAAAVQGGGEPHRRAARRADGVGGVLQRGVDDAVVLEIPRPRRRRRRRGVGELVDARREQCRGERRRHVIGGDVILLRQRHRAVERVDDRQPHRIVAAIRIGVDRVLHRRVVGAVIVEVPQPGADAGRVGGVGVVGELHLQRRGAVARRRRERRIQAGRRRVAEFTDGAVVEADAAGGAGQSRGVVDAGTQGRWRAGGAGVFGGTAGAAPAGAVEVDVDGEVAAARVVDERCAQVDVDVPGHHHAGAEAGARRHDHLALVHRRQVAAEVVGERRRHPLEVERAGRHVDAHVRPGAAGPRRRHRARIGAIAQVVDEDGAGDALVGEVRAVVDELDPHAAGAAVPWVGVVVARRRRGVAVRGDQRELRGERRGEGADEAGAEQGMESHGWPEGERGTPSIGVAGAASRGAAPALCPTPRAAASCPRSSGAWAATAAPRRASLAAAAGPWAAIGR